MTESTIKQQINDLVNVLMRCKINVNTVQEQMKTTSSLDELEQLEQLFSKIMTEQKDKLKSLDELLDTILK